MQKYKYKVISQTEKTENDIKKPIFGASFHGETWYRCPKCDKAFEFFDTKYERGFKHIEGKIYQHKCGQMLNMS